MTRLRTGQPLIRYRPSGVAPIVCAETVVGSYAANRDPEFDQFASIGAFGELTYVGAVPTASADSVFPNTTYPFNINTSGWAAQRNASGLWSTWRLVNPGSGDFAAWYQFGFSGALLATGDLGLIGSRVCTGPANGFCSSIISGSGLTAYSEAAVNINDGFSTTSYTLTMTLRLYDLSWNLLAIDTDSLAHTGDGMSFGSPTATLAASLVSTEAGYALVTFAATADDTQGSANVDSAFITVT